METLVLTRAARPARMERRREPGIRLYRTGIIHINSTLVDKAPVSKRYRVELGGDQVRLVPDPAGFTLTLRANGSAHLNLNGRHQQSPIPFDSRFLPAAVLADGTIEAREEAA